MKLVLTTEIVAPTGDKDSSLEIMALFYDAEGRVLSGLGTFIDKGAP